MAMRDRVMRILRNSDTARISFSFRGSEGTVTVNAGTFRRVAEAIENNEITVQMGGVPENVAKYSARAEGSSAANTLYIGRNLYSSRDFDALIVHEAVHASFDLTSTRIQWIDNEVAAYIAQGYYLRNSGYSTERMDSMGMPYFGRMIVNAIRGGESAEGFWMDALTNALQSDPLYAPYINSCFQGDG